MKAIFKLSYNYYYIIFSIIALIFIILFGFRCCPIVVVIGSFAMIVVFYYDMKSIARINLDELSLELKYRPFYKPKIFKYNLNDIEMISIYYSYKRYHSTILFIKLKFRDETIKHTTAMSIAKSKGIVEVLRNLNVNVIELEKPNVPVKIITLP